jgi:hypothetical protein
MSEEPSERETVPETGPLPRPRWTTPELVELEIWSGTEQKGGASPEGPSVAIS